MEEYFALSAMIERARTEGDYQSAILAARRTYRLLPTFVSQWKRKYGQWDIQSSHAVHTAPILMAVLDERDAIRELREALQAVPELSGWLPAVIQAEADQRIAVAIIAAVRQEPGLPQSRLRQQIGVSDGRRVSYVAGWLRRAGRIRGVKTGATQRLYLAGERDGGSAAGPADR